MNTCRSSAPTPRRCPHCVRVALSELLLSGVTTVADLSMAHPGLARPAGRKRHARLRRADVQAPPSWSHDATATWWSTSGTRRRAKRAMERGASPWWTAPPSTRAGRLFGMVVPAQIDTVALETLLKRERARRPVQARRELAGARRPIGGRVPRDHAPPRHHADRLAGRAGRARPTARSSATASSSTTIRQHALAHRRRDLSAPGRNRRPPSPTAPPSSPGAASP